MMNEIFLTCLSFLLLFPVIYLTGSVVEPLLASMAQSIKGIIFCALGLGFFAYFGVLIGHFEVFEGRWFVFMSMVICLLRWKRLKEFEKWCVGLWRFLFEDQGLVCRVVTGIFLFSVFLTFLMCFVPETSNDALCYQLNLPKLFVMHHSTRPIFYDLNSYMPLLMQYLYALGLALAGVSLAKLFHWITGILLFFAVLTVVYQMTRRKLLALFIGLILWLTPTLMNQVSTTYVDVALSFFLFMGVLTFWEALKQRKTAMFFISGILLGLMISVKLIALLWMAALLCCFLPVAFRILPMSKVGKMIAGLVAGGLLGCAFWFVRNGWLEGNPVFPYMNRIFGGPPLGLADSYFQVGLPKTLQNFLLLPWNLLYLPDVFERSFWIGPAYFLTLPFAVLGAWKSKEARFCLAFAFVSVIFWFFVVQNSRFLLPILPVYLVGVALGLDVFLGFFEKSFLKTIVKWMGGFLVCFLLALAVYHFRYPLRVVLCQWDIPTYLNRVERSYPIAEWVNQNLPQNAVLYNAEEIRQYYFKRDMVREGWFRMRTNFDDKIPSEDMLDYLRLKGFTHVLRAYPVDSAAKMSKLDGALADSSRAQRLITMSSKNVREPLFQYSVYKLTAGSKKT